MIKLSEEVKKSMEVGYMAMAKINMKINSEFMVFEGNEYLKKEVDKNE